MPCNVKAARRCLAVAAAFVVAGGCQAPRIPNDARLVSQWSFHPPSGWADAGNQSWRSLTPPQLVSLHVMPPLRRKPLRWILDPFSTTYSRITLCHGVPALFGEWRPWFGGTVKDEVAAQQSGSVAVASYYYPRVYTPDAGAERSIRSLCPKAARTADDRWLASGLAHPHPLVKTDRVRITTQSYLLSPGRPSVAGNFLEEHPPDTLTKSIGIHKEITQKSCSAVNADDWRSRESLRYVPQRCRAR